MAQCHIIGIYLVVCNFGPYLFIIYINELPLVSDPVGAYYMRLLLSTLVVGPWKALRKFTQGSIQH